MLPNFLIIGAPRAGTTYIHHNITLHPEIFLSDPKEIHFFDREYDKGIDYYKQYFKKANGFKVIGEATPDYLHKKEVTQKIKDHLPNAKFIICLRNPVDRLYSRYWNSKAKYVSNKNLSFEEKINRKYEFIEEGFYDEHLTRFYSMFQKQNFLIVFFDEIITNPINFLKKIYTFLEVDTGFISPDINKPVNAASGKKFLAKNLYLYYIQKTFLKIGMVSASEKIEKANKISIPKMSGKTREWLVKEVYWNHNRNLEKILNIDLSDWNQV